MTDLQTITASEIEERKSAANDLHLQGYNCAQCVICNTCDLAGVNKEDVFKLAEGLGAGLGARSEVCGCISGGALAFGALVSAGFGEEVTKKDTYQLSAALVKAFQDEYGCTTCSDLLQQGPTCGEYIMYSVEKTIEIMKAWQDGTL